MRVQIAPGLYVEIPAEQQAEWFTERKRQLETNPLIGYFPLPPQILFHQAVARHTPIVALFGGNRSGKTEGTIADDLIQALPREWVPDHLLPYKRWEPPFHMWLGCPKYAKLEEAIFPKLKKLCPPSQFEGGSFEKAYAKQDKLLRFACGSTIGFKTYDQDVDAYSSAALHRMHWDEEPEGEHGRQIRTEARARLVDYHGDEVLSMTPLFGFSWVYEKVVEKEDGKRIFVVRADMDDNIHLNEEAKEEFLADLSEEEVKARKSGEFVHFKGRVYDEFDDSEGGLHVVPKPSVEHVASLPEIYVGIDPGIRTTAVVFCGFDRDNSMLVFDELYLHDNAAIPENAAKQIRATLALWRVKPKWFIGDPSARNRSLTDGESVLTAYSHAGIDVYPGNNDRRAGVFEMKRRIQKKDANGNPAPLIHVSADNENWLRERRLYRMDDREDGVFDVIKEHDHEMDATRYVAMAHPLPVAPLPSELPVREWIPGTAPPANLAPINNTPSPPMGALS